MRQKCESEILSIPKKINLAKEFLHYLYRKPIINSRDLEEQFSLTPPRALRIIDDFVRLEILKETTGFKRNRIFVFDEYIKLFE